MNGNQVLTIERNFKASPEAVFDAWINPEILMQWWGPEGVSIPVLDLEVKEGGAWTTTMYSDQMGNRIVSGQYKIISRPDRLVFTWGWHDDEGARSGETVVEVLFEKTQMGTKMTLSQRLFTNETDRDNHGIGWRSSFVCLENTLG